MRLIVSILLGCLIAFVAWPVGATSYTVTTIDFPNAVETTCRSINDRGLIAGSFSLDGVKHHGWVRGGGTLTPIGGLVAESTVLTGINNLGQIVGYQTFPGDPSHHGILFSSPQGTNVDVPGAVDTQPFGINDSGEIVGVYSGPAGGGPRGFIRTHGQIVPLVVAGFPALGAAVNNSGEVVGTYQDAAGQVHSYRMSASGAASTIDTPGSSTPFGVNSIGQIVGGTPGFVDAFGSTNVFSVSGAVTTTVFGINNRGQWVGEYVDSASAVHCFVATPSDEVEDPSASPSPSGTRVPAVPFLFDNDLTDWTLGPDQEILWGGNQAAGGYGSEILFYKGQIYVRGDDRQWWRWTGAPDNTWVVFGPADPTGQP